MRIIFQLFVCALALSFFNQANSATVEGEIIEIPKYKRKSDTVIVRIKTKDGEYWAFVNATPEKRVGDTVIFKNAMYLSHLRIKELNQKFTNILYDDGPPKQITITNTNTNRSAINKYTSCQLKCRNSGILHDTRDLGLVNIHAEGEIQRDSQLAELCGKLSPGLWYEHSSECR